MRRAHPATARSRWHRRAATALASAIVLIGSQLVFAPSPAAAYGVTNNNPAFIQFYTNNVENLEQVDDPCPGDWLDLIMYMKTYALSPDIYLVQQVSGQAQIEKMAARMSTELYGEYRGIAAIDNPTGGVCTAAGSSRSRRPDIYRPGRFTVVNQTRWRANYDKNPTDDVTSCANETNDRSAHLGIRFRDTIANKYVSVSTVHFPTLTRGGGPCIDHNTKETGDELATLGATNLNVWGGDLNNADQSESKVFAPWYNKVNGDRGGALGWRDVIYNGCYKANPADVNNCAYDRNWTIQGENRLRDRLLVRQAVRGALPRATRPDHHVNEGDAATTRDRSDRGPGLLRPPRGAGRVYYTAGCPAPLLTVAEAGALPGLAPL